MNICLATSEMYPFSKAGGLADVSSALSQYLSRLGHDVRVFSPLYATIDTQRFPVLPVEFLQEVPLQLAGATHRYSVYTALLPDSDLWVYFVHCPEFFDRSYIYTDDGDEHLRFLVLNHAVLQSCQRMGWSPHVLHCNDWPTAVMPLIRRAVYGWDHLLSGAKTLLTIHNIGYQGVFSSAIWPTVVPQHQVHLLHQLDLRAGMVNFLKAGILYADALTTVSPTYAREIQMPELGAGLQDLLSARSDDLFGILNGVDYDDWSPRTDPLIPVRYTARNPVGGKRENKRVLLERMGLPFQERTPLVGIVSRLVAQKGFELLFEPLPQMLEQREFQMVVIGSGLQYYCDFFVWLQSRFPEKVSFYSGYNEELAHLVEAASDLFVMPSRYEPCGLSQMYSLKYGTVPVVRKTGGLADTVQQFDPETMEGTGFLFEHYTSAGLRWALDFALDVYQNRTAWVKLMRNGMSQDFSWSRQVQHYDQLYRRLVAGDVSAG